MRYRIGFDILLLTKMDRAWHIQPSFEGYFIRRPTTFERFPNERDYGLKFIRELRNNKEISFGYKVEEFYDTETESGNGHILLLGFSF